MGTRHRIELTVNGRLRACETAGRTSLADLLRDDLRLTGTHLGCEHGVCGCCTVLLDGEPVRSCLILAAQADGHRVTTIEGAGRPGGGLSGVQEAFCQAHALQCGYCTPGMVLAAQALLASNPAPGRADIDEALGGNICRCTGYVQIREAVELAARPCPGPGGEDRLSRPHPVREDRRFVTGHGRYVADLAPPGTLHAGLVTSPYAHARIVSVDAADALKLDGVAAVITGTDNPYVTNNLLASSPSWYLAPTHVLVTAAFFMLLLVETGRLPVESAGLMELGMLDDAKVMEHSGKLLALSRWGGYMKQFLFMSIFLNVFAIPWFMSTSVSVEGALYSVGTLFLKLLVLVGAIVVVEESLAKLRLFKILDFLAISFSLGLLSVIALFLVGGGVA